MGETRASPVKQCKQCGKEFTCHNGARYCSPECRHQSEIERARLKVSHPIYLTCTRCGRKYRTYHKGSVYCSKECRYPEKYARKMTPKPSVPIKRFLKPGIIPATEGWESGYISIDDEAPAATAKLKCIPSKLPDRGSPTVDEKKKTVAPTGANKYMSLGWPGKMVGEKKAQ